MTAVPGHIYVLELTDGAVKVGYTSLPKSRIRQHALKLGKTGVGISRDWISPKHVEAVANEETLKAECIRLGGQPYGSPNAAEWFTGLRFDDVVAAAEALPRTAPQDDFPSMTSGEARLNFRNLLANVRHGKHVEITVYGDLEAVVVPAEWRDRAAVALAAIGEAAISELEKS